MLDCWQYKIIIFSASRIHFNIDFTEHIQQKSNGHIRRQAKYIFSILHAPLSERTTKLHIATQLPCYSLKITIKYSPKIYAVFVKALILNISFQL